jgi:hypothetical protein
LRSEDDVLELCAVGYLAKNFSLGLVLAIIEAKEEREIEVRGYRVEINVTYPSTFL